MAMYSHFDQEENKQAKRKTNQCKADLFAKLTITCTFLKSHREGRVMLCELSPGKSNPGQRGQVEERWAK